jgi:hypothetical protein
VAWCGSGLLALAVVATAAPPPQARAGAATALFAEPAVALSPPRQRFVPADSAAPSLDLSGRARLTIVFYPDLTHCTPQEASVARALHRLLTEFSQVRCWTVVPAQTASEDLYGEPIPGSIVLLKDSAHREETIASPLPRIEVWDTADRLLLLRSLPRTVTEEEVYEEILASLAFTAPLPATPR